jgi:hypothetical protein
MSEVLHQLVADETAQAFARCHDWNFSEIFLKLAYYSEEKKKKKI